MCKKVDKCFDKPRKDVSLHPKLLREHTFILILAMKKNVYFLLALLLIGWSACDNAPKFKVQGEINGAEDKMLYLEASGLDGIVALSIRRIHTILIPFINSNSPIQLATRSKRQQSFIAITFTASNSHTSISTHITRFKLTIIERGNNT